MAKANLAWVAWRQRNNVDAEKLGKEALQLWHAMPDPYGVDWMALWPLIAIALNRKDVIRAVELARGLLIENQHPMPEKLHIVTSETIKEWQNGAKKAASSNLEAAVQLATELHYL